MQKRSGIRGTTYKKRVALGIQEKKSILQLTFCIVLFLVVLVGKGVAPDIWEDTGDHVLQLIRTDTDFGDLVKNIDEAFSRKNDMAEDYAVNEFDAQKLMAARIIEENGFLDQEIPDSLWHTPTARSILEELGIEVPAEELAAGVEMTAAAELLQSVNMPSPAYSGPALPVGASMEYVELGLTKTAVPVKGEVTSYFGYRDHPVDGERSFHTGVDIAADWGTPVCAFAAGTVDYIGESEAYGLYIQLNHGSGITTFYCHCSELLAPKGKQVSAGETIAKVGDSGNATGPHLHMELERNNILLNPLNYFEAAI